MAITVYKPEVKAHPASSVKSLYLRNYVISEMARTYGQEVAVEEIEVLSPRTQIDKGVLRSIRIDRIHSNLRRLEDCFSIN